jgi:tetratricopeptide (TPR) repeat protein
VPKSPVIRNVTRAFRRTWRAVPPFPRPPSVKQIASWWRGVVLPAFPRIPDPRQFARWWRQQRRETDLLPALPQVPSLRKTKEWFRQRQALAPVIPDIPSPANLAAWIRERPRRRKFLLASLLVAIGLFALYFTAPPVIHRVKEWQARRLAQDAFALIDTQHWNEAAAKVRDAFQIRQTEPEVWRANARLLSRTGRGAPAVEWWAKIAAVQRLSLDDRRDYAAAALSANELGLASEQVRAILSQRDAPLPADLLLEGQLAVLRGDNTRALENARRAADDHRSTPRNLLTANLLMLAAATRDSPPFVEASTHLVKLARTSPDPVSLEALTVLARQLSATPPGHTSDQPLSIPLPQFSAENISALEIADRLEQHPNARPYQKMLALEMRARAEPGREDALISHAIESYGKGDDQTVAALGAWLYTRGHFDSMLQILPLERASLSRELLVERIDALAALRRFDELKEMLLETEYSVLPQAYQHMYLAVVRARLDETAATDNEWQRALEAAGTADTLLALAEYAQKNGPAEIVDEALARAIIRQPGLRSAYVWRLRLLENIGPTQKAHDLAVEIMKLWPNDVATRMHELYLRLLLTSSPVEAGAAEQEAESLRAMLPAEGMARSTIALARLKQGHAAAAREALSDSADQPPASNVSWPVYVAVLEATGWKDKARVEAQKLSAVTMLPEERALIAPPMNP